jgi:hypothetical protein
VAKKEKNPSDSPSDTPIVESVNKQIETDILNDSIDDIEKLMSDYKESAQVTEPIQTEKTETRGRKKKIEEPSEPVIPTVISGKLLLLLIDLIVPNVASGINNKFDKKRPITAKSLKLTKDQLEELEPIANEVAKLITLNANPIVMLSVALLGIYGVNIMAQKM